MCSRFLLVLALFFATLSFNSTYAQTQGKPSFLLSGGFSKPSGPQVFSDYWKFGFNAGAGFEAPLSPQVSFVGAFDYSQFPIDTDAMWEAAG